MYFSSLQHPEADVSEPNALVISDDSHVVIVASVCLKRTVELQGNTGKYAQGSQCMRLRSKAAVLSLW